MSRRYNKRDSKLIILILIIIALSGGFESILGILGGMMSVVGGLIFFAILLAAIVSLLTKAGKKDSKYTETKRRSQTNMNPYSASGYNKAKAEEHDAKNQASRQDKYYQTSAKPVEAVKQEVKEEQKHKTTGDPEIDKMIVDKDLAIQEMKRLDEAIEDEKLSEQIVHLQSVTDKIVEYIIAHPKKKNQVGKFFNYYLPTTLKLLNAYDRMDDAGISGTNIDGTKEKVEDMMDTALAAFDKQLDALFADEALDVSTDIKVMENLLKAEGLTGDEITLTL